MIIPQQPIITEVINSQSYDGIWIRNLQIQAQNPTQPISITARLIPFNSTSSLMAPSEYGKSLIINDLYAQIAVSPEIGTAMQAVFSAIQSQIISQSLF